MNYLTHNQETDIYIIGDPHKDYNAILYWLNSNDLYNIALIGVGDFPRGLGYEENKIKEEKEYALLNEEFKKRNVFMWNIRGNHDNPSYFDGKHDFSNLKFVPDYTILKINDLNIFCLGGATSIDRHKNTEGVDWFPDEKLKIIEEELPNIINIDVMITHTAPYGVAPFLSFKSNEEDEISKEQKKILDTEINIERHELREFLDKIIDQNPNLNKYFYGHFHKDVVNYIGNIKYTMVSIANIIPL